MKVFLLAFVAALAVAVAAAGSLGTARAGQSDDCSQFPTDGSTYACSVSVSQDFQDMVVDATPCLPEPFLASGRVWGHDHLVFNPQKLVGAHFAGTGLVSGTHYEYHGTGHSTQSVDFDGDASVDTITETAIGNGPGPNDHLVLHITEHQTIDATGRYHLTITNALLTCGSDTEHDHTNPSNT